MNGIFQFHYVDRRCRHRRRRHYCCFLSYQLWIIYETLTLSTNHWKLNFIIYYNVRFWWMKKKVKFGAVTCVSRRRKNNFEWIIHLIFARKTITINPNRKKYISWNKRAWPMIENQFEPEKNLNVQMKSIQNLHIHHIFFFIHSSSIRNDSIRNRKIVYQKVTCECVYLWPLI